MPTKLADPQTTTTVPLSQVPLRTLHRRDGVLYFRMSDEIQVKVRIQDGDIVGDGDTETIDGSEMVTLEK